MVTIVASLENGTYEENYGKLNERELTIEEYTSLMLNGEPKPTKRENINIKFTDVSENEVSRWNRIKESYINNS